MAADDHFESVRHRCGRRGDDKTRADARTKRSRNRGRHRGRGFARRDDADRGGTAEAVPYEKVPSERVPSERVLAER
jgi:hypothetical protein